MLPTVAAAAAAAAVAAAAAAAVGYEYVGLLLQLPPSRDSDPWSHKQQPPAPRPVQRHTTSALNITNFPT